MLRFPMSLDLIRRLPRHPDWKYELIEGVAYRSPRAKPIGLTRPTAVTVSASSGRAGARLIGGDDRPGVVALLSEVWGEEDPYRSYEPEVRRTELAAHIERGSEDWGVLVERAGKVVACAMVHRRATLSWLSVASDARGQGLAGELLAVICGELVGREKALLKSWVSVANVPSLRWHLSRGFTLAPDEFRELRR